MERLAHAITNKFDVPGLKSKTKACVEQGEKGPMMKQFMDTHTDCVRWLSDGTIDAIAGFVTGSVSLAMLIGPLWMLNTVSTTDGKLRVVTGLIMLFYLMMTFLARAEISERIFAVSVYSVLLAVFLALGTPAS